MLDRVAGLTRYSSLFDNGAELVSTGQGRFVVARRGASLPRKKDAQLELPISSTHSQLNAVTATA